MSSLRVWFLTFLILLGISTPSVAQIQGDTLNRLARTRMPTDTIPAIPAFTRMDPTPLRPSLSESHIHWNRFAISSGLLGAAVGGLHIYQMNAWWANQRTKFHVIDDNEYKANFDKFGHMYGAYISSHVFDEAFSWSGFDSSQSAAIGAACGALWEIYIEIEDGFARGWGFSRGDARSDILGAAFYFVRSQVPVLKNFKYKISYIPSQQYIENRPDIPGQTLNFIEDYGGQSYWMGINVHGLLPESAKPYWPDWLNLAVGIGGWNLDATKIDSYGQLVNDFGPRKLAWYVSLDYDIVRIFPESNWGILDFIRRGLDYVHFPAPAYRISPEPRFFILFPLRMSIG